MVVEVEGIIADQQGSTCISRNRCRGIDMADIIVWPGIIALLQYDFQQTVREVADFAVKMTLSSAS